MVTFLAIAFVVVIVGFFIAAAIGGYLFMIGTCGSVLNMVIPDKRGDNTYTGYEE